jgi:hypothetical protein
MKNKIIVVIFIFLLITGVVGTFWGTQIAEAASGIWNSCPRGETNCKYPGKCSLYIDTNNDRICDRSQPAPQMAVSTPGITSVSAAAATNNASIPVATTAPSSTPAIYAGGMVAEILPSGNSNNVSISSQNEAVNAPAKSGLKNSYYFLPILLAMVILYAATWTLSARKVIKTLLHRKIWNMVLLVSMLVSAVLGIFLILAIDFNIQISLPFNMLFWHVEAGIALSIIAVFHIFWHWRYFAKLATGKVKNAV